MKTMKKFLMVLLGAALVLSMAGAVGADDNGFDANGNSLTIKTTIAESYTITLPAEVPTLVGQTKSSTLQIAATNILIGQGKSLKVTATSDFTLADEKTGSTGTITYKMYYLAGQVVDATTEPTGEVISETTELINYTPNGQTTGVQSTYTNIAFQATANAPYAGSYTDTITFTVTCA